MQAMPHRGRLALVALLALACLLLGSAASFAAVPRTGRHARVAAVRWVTPGRRASVAGGVSGRRCRVHVIGSAVRAVQFRLDGHPLSRDVRAPYSCQLWSPAVRDGAHTLTATALDAVGRRVKATVRIVVSNHRSTSGSNATASGEGMPAQWSDSFESGDFSAWSWWGQGDPTYAHRDVVDPTSEGVAPHSGTHAARFETTPDDIAAGRIHAKLYKSFGTNLDTPQSKSPANVSGTYSAWYYLPTTYHIAGPDDWVSIFQFKEQYRVPSGPAQSDPLWWVQMNNLDWAKSMATAWKQPLPQGTRPDQPVAFVSRWGSDWKVKRNFVPVPLGRWFQVTAVVHQNDRIDLTLDGQKLDTVYASEYHVGPFHGTDSTQWIFGVGNYSNTSSGPLYVDDASYRAG